VLASKVHWSYRWRLVFEGGESPVWLPGPPFFLSGNTGVTASAGADELIDRFAQQFGDTPVGFGGDFWQLCCGAPADGAQVLTLVFVHVVVLRWLSGCGHEKTPAWGRGLAFTGVLSREWLTE
jgi:hypothetical protein